MHVHEVKAKWFIEKKNMLALWTGSVPKMLRQNLITACIHGKEDRSQTELRKTNQHTEVLALHT